VSWVVSSLNLLARRANRAVAQRLKTQRLGRALQVRTRGEMVNIGTRYGGWSIPADRMGAESVCYLAGLGEDASFDLGVIERFGCDVHTFDPVPEAARYAATVSAREPRFHFHPCGLWSSDGALRFYANTEPGFVSRSATNMHGTGDYTEAQVRSVDSLMAELGHARVDLLKLSVEGSEYEIVDDLLAKSLPVRAVCVEFSQPAPVQPVLERVAAMQRGGYALVAAILQPSGWKLTFSLE
jgi:FkbM family methyltransferase